MDRRSAATRVILGLQVLAAACGSRVGSPRGPGTSEAAAPRPGAGAIECALIAEPGEPVATVGLGGRVDPANAPRPSNESERLLFRQLYETLIGLDCNGRMTPGLASSWRLDADGRAWIVTLRENARFSDGTPVTAADVRESWTRGGTGTGLGPQVSRVVESVVALDDRALAITLRDQRVDAPRALAHTDLAVARPAADSPWPLGTRSSRVTSTARPGAVARSEIVLERDDLPPVRFLVAPGDPRDLLDAGVDLLLTRDPTALDYAATLPPFHSIPLAWHRTLVLVTPGRSGRLPALSYETRQALADDAVRGEARGAQDPFWWQTPLECETPASPPRDPSAQAPRIVYDAADHAAGDLAGRLVALAAYERAIGLTGEALARARRSGTDAGYIVSLDRRAIVPCRDLQLLMDTAPWLDPGTMVPLVDTRLQAIVRRGRSGVTAEWDGGLLLAPMDGPP